MHHLSIHLVHFLSVYIELVSDELFFMRFKIFKNKISLCKRKLYGKKLTSQCYNAQYLSLEMSFLFSNAFFFCRLHKVCRLAVCCETYPVISEIEMHYPL